MDGVRAKLSLKTEEGLTRVTIAWVNVVAGQIVETQFTEEFQVSSSREGCAYVSRVVFNEAQALPTSFFIDENGLRHFTLNAEAANLSSTGQRITG